MRDVHIAVDIDGNIDMRNLQAFKQKARSVFNLQLPEAELDAIGSRQDLIQLEEMQEKCQQMGKEVFFNKLGWIDFTYEVLLASQPIPGARDGVSQLAQLSSDNLAYYTARYTEGYSQLNQEMLDATLLWLEMHKFPCTKSVVICKNLLDKLVKLAEYTPGKNIVLIDDSYQRILE